MKKIEWRKIMDRQTLVVVSLAALLCVAAFLNYRLGDTPQAVQDYTQTLARDNAGGSYADYKQQRQDARVQELKTLDSIINGKGTDQDSLKAAQQRKMELGKSMETESTMEGLLAAMGLKDTLVTVRPGSVNVVVKGSTIGDADAAKILEMAMRESGEEADRIKIIPAK